MFRTKRPLFRRNPDTKALDEQTAMILGETSFEAQPPASDSQDELNDLVSIVRDLARTLVPVEPAPEFSQPLKARLLEMHARQVEAAREVASRRGLANNPKTLRTILSIFAVAAVLARVLASVVMIIAILMNRRRRSATAV